VIDENRPNKKYNEYDLSGELGSDTQEKEKSFGLIWMTMI
jgi:hypothetical protein